MKTFQLFLLITGLAYSTAAITVEVRLHSYSNPNSRECDGDDCDLAGECDNIFEFCLRAVGSSVCLPNKITTNELSEDTLSFSESELSDLGISNPLRFPGITTSTELELFVRITDVDSIVSDELVDTFIIPFDSQQRPDSTFGSLITRSGSCGIGTSISVSINITSVCPTPNFIGPQCTCTERENQNTCTYFGERQCLGNFAPDDCNDCITGFQGPGCTQTSELPSTSTVSGESSESDTFVGSLVFIVVVGVGVAIPFLALFFILCILCVMCALSSNWSCPRLDCSCPKLDCSCPSFDCSCPSLDCSCPSLPKINCDKCNCSDFCKWLTCGFKLDDANPCVLCIICILGILAAPAVILLLVVVGPVFLIGACLVYFLLQVCES